MPRHLPIRSGDLVEQDSSNRETLRTKDRYNQFANDRRACETLHLGGYIEKVPNGEDAAALPH